jgi:membrane-bound lytic murein transglycosylase B
MTAGLVADVDYVQSLRDAAAATVIAENATAETDVDVAPMPVIDAYLTYPNFYRIKKWNNSNWYAIAIATLADRLK